MLIGEALKKVVAGEDLTQDEARDVMAHVMAGEATPVQIAGLLVALRMKGETAEELAGFAQVMRENAVRVPVSVADVVDTCGTGGDIHDTFNISTAAAFVAAAAGVPIAKHGNRSVTSRCGSADVLEALGVPLDLTPEQVGRCVDEAGIGFLFAPALHPAMRHAAPVRRELGLRTVFNLLGPLTNPAGARRQVLGVFAPEWVRPVAEALLELGAVHAMVIHGVDGLDELSTLGPTLVAEVRNGAVKEYTVRPEDFQMSRCSAGDLAGGDPAQSAQILLDVLSGAEGPRADVVALNAAAAIYVGGRAGGLREGLAVARDTLRSGAARNKLEELCAAAAGMATERDTSAE
ncbi:MAG: anthranilate phosphoribosyltransferase [Armatimonadetes bacterium]|nr:anthranilate phosphoribosyltransferase [Armatimonadota bacterium]